MKILVFGAGSLGSVIGALLSEANDVHLVTRGEHLEAVKRGGLRLQGIIDSTFRIKATEKPTLVGDFDLILITTKAYDTKTAAEACRKKLRKDGAAVCVQNGIGNLEKLISVFGAERSVAGVTSMAVHRTAPGVVQYVSEGKIVIGTDSKDDAALGKVEKAFAGTKVLVERSGNIQGTIWEKAIVNSAINTLTAVFNCRNGLVAENPMLEAQAEKICQEGKRVAEALGIRLEPENVIEHMFDVAMKTADNRSSMLVDIEAKRRTEADEICGPILEAAKRSNIETPALKRIYMIVKYLESRDELLRKLNMQSE